MIAEDYVSFETAKLLKEKGFDLSDRDITGCKKIYSMDFPTKNAFYETYEEAAEAAIKCGY